MAEGLDINELTFWFYVQNHGFIDQVTEFARKHANEFKEKDDGHSLKETSLHAEFQQEFESKVQEFVDSKGSTMADLQTALQETTVDGQLIREQNLFASAKLLYAYTGDDPAAEVLVNVMLSMLDFELFAKTMREMAAVRPKSIFAQVALRS